MSENMIPMLVISNSRSGVFLRHRVNETMHAEVLPGLSSFTPWKAPRRLPPGETEQKSHKSLHSQVLERTRAWPGAQDSAPEFQGPVLLVKCQYEQL